MDKQQLIQLAEKIVQGTASDQEIAQYNQWYQFLEGAEDVWNEEQLGRRDEKSRLLLSQIEAKLVKKQKSPRRTIRLSVAAAVAGVVLIGALLYLNGLDKNSSASLSKSSPALANSQQPIVPGKDRAILTLSTGRKITLDETNVGQLSEEEEVRISKTAEGQLVYELKSTNWNSSIVKDPSTKGSVHVPKSYNVMETPRGGQYQIILPDGTKVWLNAASSLTYPVTFSKTERMVSLKGEAYFEVTKSDHLPFIVQAEGQRVEVLGTHFNVNAYEDEGAVRTTLLEGSVKISAAGRGYLLKAGQQAILRHSDQSLYVQSADLEKTIAWKNGYFIFNKENIRSIMRQVARWYDVDIVYKGTINEADEYVGKLRRKADISQILKIFQLGNVTCSIKGRTVIIDANHPITN